MTFTYTFSYFLVTVVCALIALIILFQININLGSEQEVRSFRNYVGWYVGFIMSNMIWVWINYGYLKIDGTVFSMINLISICVASFYWFKYIEAILSTDFVKRRVFRIVSIAPLVIALALIISTPFTKLVFYYNEKNEYIHGRLYPTMFLLAVSYLIFASVHLIIKMRDTGTKSQRQDYLVLAAFLFFPVAAGLLDIVAENLPIMELALLFGTVLVYTHTLRSQIFYDRLTQLNNRSAADNYMQERLTSTSEISPLVFFMGDVDEFKYINDTYGHLEGDRALRIVAASLQRYSEENRCFVARWGGDEFCIIFKSDNIPNPEDVIKGIQRIIDEEVERAGAAYGLTLSMGYAMCKSPLGSPEKIIEAADKMLYENKQVHRAGA